MSEQNNKEPQGQEPCLSEGDLNKVSGGAPMLEYELLIAGVALLASLVEPAPPPAPSK